MKKYTTSQRLKQLMSERGLKQVDILKQAEPYCEKYSVKLNRNDLSQYVNGKVEPGQQKLSILGMALNVNEAWLMGFDNVPQSRKTALSIEGTISSNASLLPADKIRMIPIYESVSAGFGAYADNCITGYTPCYIVNDEEAQNTLCITVQGDSMYPKIENGDLVQVLRQDWAENGQIAVVLIDGENGLVKKFQQDKDAITLISINPEYPPKVFEGVERTRVRILGVVKKIIKEV